MTEAEASAPKPRSRKLYVLWAIALTLLLTLGIFCWLVVVPVWQVRREVVHLSSWDAFAKGRDYFGYDAAIKKAVRQLGGPEAAALRVRNYLKLPTSVAPCRGEAFHVLDYCGRHGADAIQHLTDHGPEDVRTIAKEWSAEQN